MVDVDKKCLIIFTKSLFSVIIKMEFSELFYNFGDVVVTTLCDIFAVYR